MDTDYLAKLCKLIRYDVLVSTTAAQSGHPTSSLSAVELMTTLFFGGFLKYDLKNPKNLANDRVIFSKGHASPLLYSLYQAAGVVSHEELLTLRQFGSVLEGHPTPKFKYVDVATGSLGQGLSVGLGIALGLRKIFNDADGVEEKLPKIWVLMGDSEMSEGQIWEAMEVASFYKVNNIIGIVDVNRLGQRGETMLGWDIKTYAARIESFGWEAVKIEDGHNLDQVNKAFQYVTTATDPRPKIIIAKTIKGKGFSLWENQDNWHGKPLPKEKLEETLKELGEVDLDLKGEIANRQVSNLQTTSNSQKNLPDPEYLLGDLVATRDAYGDALVALGKLYPNLVVLDAELSNSTKADKFKTAYPERFFEMFIAEQNMVSVATGMSAMGLLAFSSTFGSFLTRAFDQIRMAQYSDSTIKLAGSHTGVSIGKDGPSQMGLEDLAMMRSILNSVVVCPADAVSAFKLTGGLLCDKHLGYLRLMRDKLPVIYNDSEEFPIGGSKILHRSFTDKAVVFALGVTVHEALKAYKELGKFGLNFAVVDLYSVKPLDEKTIVEMADKIKKVIIVEDHYSYGGLGEAVKGVLPGKGLEIRHLAVSKIPKSGGSDDLLSYEGIDAAAIMKTVQEMSLS